ncbi:MAG TPA: AzlC family ABC transporter permease [Xanthobacteraceae bacterium]|nr:AzlC family ABC transporter permease [Xanthobacteraceae bacterium]
MDSASPPSTATSLSVFADGYRTALKSVYVYVLFGTYVGFGALAHDLGFNVIWAACSTALVWAGPAQVIIVSSLGTGSTLIQAAIAVGLSGMRLLPMVVALLPLIKTPSTRFRHLLLPSHFTAVSMWVEALRLVPGLPRERRIAFCNGLGAGLMTPAVFATFVGYFLAAQLPPLFAAAVLFLTPMSFLVSTVRNSRTLVDRLALALGLVLAPIFAALKFQLDLLLAGLVAGTLAYLVHRAREALR